MIKKKAVAGGIVALAAVLGGGGIFAWTRRTADTETLADNQKYVYAYVTSIEGNELTYMEVDESVVEAYLASSTEDTENTEKGGDGSGAPGGSDGSGAPGQIPQPDVFRGRAVLGLADPLGPVDARVPRKQVAHGTRQPRIQPDFRPKQLQGHQG